MIRKARKPNRIKKLYRVTTMVEGQEGIARTWEVAAADAQQAIRKALYNLTITSTKGISLEEEEYIDGVERLGVIEIK